MKTYLLLIASILLLTCLSCSESAILGCTDSNSFSYNPDATEDDGSCQYERDLILGRYTGSVDCNDDKYDDGNFSISLGAVSNSTTDVSISLACCPKLKFQGTYERGFIIVQSTVQVQDLPDCSGTNPFNGAPFNGTVTWSSSWKVDGGTITINELSDNRKNENGDTICSLSCSGQLTKSG